mgnify:CR=1 FL=1
MFNNIFFLACFYDTLYLHGGRCSPTLQQLVIYAPGVAQRNVAFLLMLVRAAGFT